MGVKKQDILKVIVDSLKLRSIALSSKKQHDENLQYVKHNLKRVSHHKKLLNKWRYKEIAKEKQELEEASLDLTELGKLNYRENKETFQFFGGAYLRIIKRKEKSKYERKIFIKRLLKQRYITFLKKKVIKN